MTSETGYLAIAIAKAEKEAKRFASLGNKEAQKKHATHAAALRQLQETGAVDMDDLPVMIDPFEWVATIVTDALGNVKRVVIEREEIEEE